MPDIEAQHLAEQVVLLGLVEREQVRQAMHEADDGSVEALERVLFRKQLLTSWQLEKLHKGGELSGFFYGGYKVLYHLAEGTFARVYRGENSLGRQPVAIKVLRQRFVSDPQAVERFIQEAEAGKRLVHPNIVRIFDYGEEDKRSYMVLEYVEGNNLRDLLKLRGQVPLKEAMPLILGMARGLKYSHEHNVAHRDIKGTNILVSNSGEAKLVDFGLANIGTEDKRGLRSERTIDYSALERTCHSVKGDPRSDIYFLGCVFYQLLTGVLPLPEVETKDPLAKMLKRSFGAIRPLAEQRDAPPEELCQIIDRMMKIDLSARYQTMEEVVSDLERFERQMTTMPERALRHGPRMGAVGSIITDEDEEHHQETAVDGVMSFEVAALTQKSVLCVELQPEIQDALRKSLTKMGYRVLLMGDAESAAERYRESPADGLIYDCDGLGADALTPLIDMHEKAHEDGHQLVGVVLLGPKQRSLADRVPQTDRLTVISKPIRMRQIQDALRALVPPGLG